VLHDSQSIREGIKQERSKWKREDVCIDGNKVSLCEGDYFSYH
jgi:hypothetical protein